jgi:hypothetical protein
MGPTNTDKKIRKMESVGRLISKLYKAYQLSNDRFWRVSDHRRDAGGRRLKLDLLGYI